MHMSKELPINHLPCIALDWLIGEAMGYPLRILPIGTKIDRYTFSATKVMLEQSAPSTSNVIRLNSFNDLRLFNPSQDWELLPPPSYYSSRGKVLDTALFYAYQKGDDHNHLLGNWLCSFMNEGEKEAMVGATKQEAICRAVICILGGYWHQVPSILLEDTITA